MPVATSILVALTPPTTPAIRTIALAGVPQEVVLDPSTGRAVVLGSAATVSVVDLVHARVERTFRGGDAGTGVPVTMALDADTQRLFVADPRNGLGPSVVRVLDSHSGALRGTTRVGRMACAMAVDTRSGRVFVADEYDGAVSMLDARSGALLRTVPVAAAPVALAVDAAAGRVFVLHWLTQRGPVSGRSRVSVLDARSGALLRTVLIGSGYGAMAVAARADRVFVADEGADSVSMLDAHSGTLLRTVAVGRQPTTLAVDERRGLVYVVNAGAGTLGLLDGRTGTLLHTTRVARAASLFDTPPYALAVDDARDRVYLSAWGPLWPQGGAALHGAGTLFVLAARTGAIQRRLTVGVAPQAVAVDERSGRVVVVNVGGVIHAPESWLAAWTRQAREWLPWLGRSAASAQVPILVPGSVSVIAAPS